MFLYNNLYKFFMSLYFCLECRLLLACRNAWAIDKKQQNGNWRDKKAYQDINVDGKTIHDKTIAQILDKSIFANVGRDDVVFEMSSSYSLFSKFYGHDIYWKPLKI